MSSPVMPGFEEFAFLRDETLLAGSYRPCLGFPLLLLHGLAGTHREWDKFIGLLDPELSIVALDLRGHGQSDRNPTSVAPRDFVADCEYVLLRLGIERVVVVGQSMGGIVATLFAAAVPDRVEALILIEAGMDGTAPTEDFSGLRSWLEGQDIDPIVALNCIRSLNESDRWRQWTGLTKPCLVCTADRSFLAQNELDRMKQARPDFGYQPITNTGHDIHLDQPEALADAVASFLTSAN